jgi:pyruvate/2-oxoglutarate dehydrogenase complex dihydrolipoamide acyltransferase (E2) component
VHIGVAVSLGEKGLIVPVIRDADRKSLLQLALDINDLAARSRNRQLKPEEVQGGTFTITNHGVSGSLFATPIINQPQCAILGVGAIQKRAVVIQDAIAIRPMVYISLTFDHRILDGASADGFLARVVQALQEWA